MRQGRAGGRERERQRERTERRAAKRLSAVPLLHSLTRPPTHPPTHPQVGLRYEPLFPYFAHLADTTCFRVVSDGYVTDDSGTGVVHQVAGRRGGVLLGTKPAGAQTQAWPTTAQSSAPLSTHPHPLQSLFPQAPAFGEDDYRVCIGAGVVEKGEGLPCPVDLNGRFTEDVPEYAGM
jgi:isoleucyl-tRNA synthetase